MCKQEFVKEQLKFRRKSKLKFFANFRYRTILHRAKLRDVFPEMFRNILIDSGIT